MRLCRLLQGFCRAFPAFPERAIAGTKVANIVVASNCVDTSHTFHRMSLHDVKTREATVHGFSKCEVFPPTSDFHPSAIKTISSAVNQLASIVCFCFF